jgi:hypothetical protein
VTFVPEALSASCFVGPGTTGAHLDKEHVMQKMKFFIDTHDQKSDTFPSGISKDDFASFYEKYEAACAEEGVISLRIHVGLDDGRAFCLNMAPDAEAVRRVHQKVGLPFETLTEVTTVTPGDLFFAGKAA